MFYYSSLQLKIKELLFHTSLHLALNNDLVKTVNSEARRLPARGAGGSCKQQVEEPRFQLHAGRLQPCAEDCLSSVTLAGLRGVTSG